MSTVQQGDVRGQFERFPQLVGGHDDSFAGGQGLAQEALQDGDGAVVKRREGLVEQHHGRLVEKRAGHRQALPHAAREFAHQAVTDAFQTGAFQPFVGRFLGVRKAVELAEENQVFERRKLVVDRNAVP